MSLSKDHTYVRLLSVADVDKQNWLLSQLLNKGLKLIGEWEDDESVVLDHESNENVDETLDTN